LFVQIVTAMGGLASEELVFGEHSTGAEQDLERATDIARDMVGRFGMGSKRRRLLARDVDEYIQGEVALSEISSETHEQMEAEVDKLIHEAEKEASHILERHRQTLDVVAKRLMTEETLEGTELDKALAPVRPDVGRHIDTDASGGRSGNGKAPVEGDVPVRSDETKN
jgi:cell division protease FtsH